MQDGQVVTFCRICEPLCGMVATVENGELKQLRPDPSHPVSKGFACPKGIAFEQVHNDPDRVTEPLKRQADGSFTPVSWDVAMSDIKKRLKAIYKEHGRDSIGWYFGNPGAFSYSHTLWSAAFMMAVGSPHMFTAGSQDVNNRFVASEYLYGNPITAPIPDLKRNRYLLIIGANPLVSHGSVITAPRIKEELHGIVNRGGQVTVVDPRRTETAKAFDWQPINPDTDMWFLLSLLNVMFDENLVQRKRLKKLSTGGQALQQLASEFPPEETESKTGIPANLVRQIARKLARIPEAAVYGRIGTSTGSAGTATTYLLDCVNLVAGNLDSAGGSLFGTIGVPFERFGMLMMTKFVPSIMVGARRSRIGNFPSVLGSEPAAIMAREITTPGKGQVRAMFVSAGNPALSVPNGNELEAALEQLDLMVSIDIYRNETSAHADYILPATTMYERSDFPLPFQALSLTPFRQATQAIVKPRGQAREEWEVIDQLMVSLWSKSPALFLMQLNRVALRLIGKRLSPRLTAQFVVRMGTGGDKLGLCRHGLNLQTLEEDEQHGRRLSEYVKPGGLRTVVLNRRRKVRLDSSEVFADIRRREVQYVDDAATAGSEFPLRLIGMRELRSENSWMHNPPLLRRGGRKHAARINSDDARKLGISEGQRVLVNSKAGQIEIEAMITDDLVPGTVAIPHGWGHKKSASWQGANTAIDGGGGANVNLLMSTDDQDIEPLAGMSRLSGVPINIMPINH